MKIIFKKIQKKINKMLKNQKLSKYPHSLCARPDIVVNPCSMKQPNASVFDVIQSSFSLQKNQVCFLNKLFDPTYKRLNPTRPPPSIA